MIKALIFDLGGVFFPEKTGVTSKRASKQFGFNWKTYRELSDTHKEKVLEGDMQFKELLFLLKEKEGIPHSMEKILEFWEESYSKLFKLNKPLVKYVEKAQKKYSVAMISNIYDFTAEYHKKTTNIFAAFEPCVLSCEVKMKKPNPKIFNLTLKKLKLKPSECVFIDDRESNCIAAKNLGINALQFTNNKKLFADLKKLGVAVD